MKIKNFFMVLTISSLLSGCATTNSHAIKTSNNDLTNISTKEMQTKKAEQEKLLEHYQSKSYLYGRQAQDLESHCQALIRNYQQAIEEANANDAKQKPYSSLPTQQ